MRAAFGRDVGRRWGGMARIVVGLSVGWALVLVPGVDGNLDLKHK